MVRGFALLALAGCWTSKPAPKEPEPEPPVIESRRPPPPEEPTCTIRTFDPSNAACEDVCTPTAPQDWPGCVRLADSLIAQGYICQRRTPSACQPPPRLPCPPQGCVGIKARVIALSITGSSTVVTIGAGANQGVALTWKANLIDQQDRPVPNGEITLVRVDQHRTTGTLLLTADQIKATGRVHLEP